MTDEIRYGDSRRVFSKPGDLLFCAQKNTGKEAGANFRANSDQVIAMTVRKRRNLACEIIEELTVFQACRYVCCPDVFSEVHML